MKDESNGCGCGGGRCNTGSEPGVKIPESVFNGIKTAEDAINDIKSEAGKCREEASDDAEARKFIETCYKSNQDPIRVVEHICEANGINQYTNCGRSALSAFLLIVVRLAIKYAVEAIVKMHPSVKEEFTNLMKSYALDILGKYLGRVDVEERGIDCRKDGGERERPLDGDIPAHGRVRVLKVNGRHGFGYSFSW